MTDSRISVVIPCHDERRWAGLVAAVSSAAAQTQRPAEIVVVVDHNEALFERASRELTGVTVLRNRFAQGASGTRNTGAFHTTSPLIAFLDDDAVAPRHWLAGLMEPFADPRVVGTGGGLSAHWERQPRWVPDEFLWAYGVSYPGMPTTTAVVRNVWSASMAVRRDVFDAVGGFQRDFGKVGSRSRPEDTDLCLRMAKAGGGHWVYVPDSAMGHRVPQERSTLTYFLRRCYHEGRGKVEMARLNPSRDSLGSERHYLRQMPRVILRRLGDTLRGHDRYGASKAAAIFAGLTAAGIGAVTETTHGFRTTAGRSSVEAGR